MYKRGRSEKTLESPVKACGINLKIENGWEDLIRETTLLSNEVNEACFQ